MKTATKAIKKIIAVVLCIMMLCSTQAIGAFAATEYTSGNFTYTVSSGNATVTAYPETAKGEVEIPATLGGYPVIAIDDYAFFGCTVITSVKIPSGVKTIGDYAFAYCTTLSEIEIPASVTKIGKNAFSTSNKLADIYYGGTEDDWEKITISSGNEQINKALIHYEYKNSTELKVYTSSPNLCVGTEQEIRFAVSLFEDGKQVKSVNGYSVVNSSSSHLKQISSYQSGMDQIFVFEGKIEGDSEITFIEKDNNLQQTIPIKIGKDCLYYRCESMDISGTQSIGSIYISDFTCSHDTDGNQKISFNAYNTYYSYATVEVYDSEGNFIKSAGIFPKVDNSGMEKVIDSFKYVWIDITDHTTPWYKKESNSQHTYIEFAGLPKNSVVRITSDGKKSDLVTLYNGVDIFVNVVMFASGIDISKEAQKASVKELLKNVLESLPENSLKSLSKSLSTAMLSGATGESVSKVYELIFNMFAEIGINYKQILTNVLKGLGYGALDEIVTTVVPYWRIVTAVDDVTAIAWTILSYSKFEYGTGETKIYILKHGMENRLVENGVSVSQTDSFSDKTILDAYRVEESDELSTLPDSFDSKVVYNITLRENGESIQPKGEIEIRIPVPDGMSGTNCIVYRLEEDGSKTIMPTYLDDGYLVFKTTHLSYYVVSDVTDIAIRELDYIQILSLPTVNRYKYGIESLETSGLEIIATYSDGSTAILDNSEVEFTGFDTSERGIKTITATYEGCTATFDIEVYYTFWQWLLYIICFGWIWM